VSLQVAREHARQPRGASNRHVSKRSNQRLLERLEAENAQLRGSVVDLMLQIQALRDGSTSRNDFNCASWAKVLPSAWTSETTQATALSSTSLASRTSRKPKRPTAAACETLAQHTNHLAARCASDRGQPAPARGVQSVRGPDLGTWRSTSGVHRSRKHTATKQRR